MGLLACLAWLHPVVAQVFYTPSTADLLAPGSTTTTANGTGNTGTDFINANGTTYQVMVWDKIGTQVILSWSVNNGAGVTGSLPIVAPVVGANQTKISDPDVTLALYNGGLFAAVVYLAKDESLGVNATVQTYLDIYQWNGSAFVRYAGFNSGVPKALGVAGISNAYGTANRIHSSPNIDANAAGRIGIVWQETSTETANIRVISPSYPGPGGYSFNQVTTFAESYVLPGNIDGSGFLCLSYRGALATQLAGGSVPNPPILFNQSLSPDVAVAPGGAISFCYISATANPTSIPVTAGIRLVVKQYLPDCFTFNADYGSYSWDITGTTGVPRMAATAHTGNTNDLDVEIVMSWQGSACLDGIGPRTYYEIRNWGRSAGVFREGPTIVSLPTVASQNGYKAEKPVVAFCGAEKPAFSDRYVVAWEGLDYPKNSAGTDVWSTTLIAGVRQTSDYSRVNNTASGTQSIPSVAGRYSGVDKSMAYLFWDSSVPQLSYRYATVQAGVGSLNRTAADPSGATGSTGPARVIDAYPNPSTSAIDFNLHLRAGEVVQQLSVADMMGRVLDKVAVPSSQDTDQVVNWQPKRALPEGSYVVKLVTNQRTENITINRNR